MNRILAFIAAYITAFILPAAAAATTHTPNAPPPEFIDRGACPFECCVYRDWTTTREVTLVDKPRSSHVVIKIPTGRTVTGVTGQVISKPVRWVAVRDLEEGIHKGDVYYLLHYAGEGYWAVWHRGRVVNVSLEAQDGAKDGGAGDQSVWWVQIRTRDGHTGWAVSTDNFANQDSCG